MRLLLEQDDFLRASLSKAVANQSGWDDDDEYTQEVAILLAAQLNENSTNVDNTTFSPSGNRTASGNDKKEALSVSVYRYCLSCVHQRTDRFFFFFFASF